MANFQERIEYQGDLKLLLRQVCKDYDFGDYLSHKVIPVGYEDLNVVLVTSKAKLFVKIFAKFRSQKDCLRYVGVMLEANKAGVSHPRIYKSKIGELYEAMMDGSIVRLCLMEFIEGKTFYDLRQLPTTEELRFLAHQAAIINNLPIKPDPVYDSWAIVNLVKEFEEKQQYLSKKDSEVVTPVYKEFRKVNLDQLPHCFVHGDIIKTNVMRSNTGDLYILDFSVSNYYPRVQELAVLFCDLFFNEKYPTSFKKNYDRGLFEYQKDIQLTPEELKIMPLYIQAAHVMHIICANYEREVNGNTSKENESWLNLGRIGLRYTVGYLND